MDLGMSEPRTAYDYALDRVAYQQWLEDKYNEVEDEDEEQAAE